MHIQVSMLSRKGESEARKLKNKAENTEHKQETEGKTDEA